MIAILSALVGAVLGALSARRRKGTTADLLQYAAVYGILFGLVALFASIFLLRLT